MSVEQAERERVQAVIDQAMERWTDAKLAAALHTAEDAQMWAMREHSRREVEQLHWKRELAALRAWQEQQRIERIGREARRVLRYAESHVCVLASRMDALLNDNVRRLHETGFYIEEAPKRRRGRVADVR